ATFRYKIIAMPDGLGIEEYGVENDGDDADETELRLRVNRSGRRRRGVGQDQRDSRKPDQDAEIDVGARHLKLLLAVTQAGGQNAEADEAVAYDHHHREH